MGASGSAFNSGQLEQGPHLIEREAQFACPADEHKSPHIGSAIAAIPPGAIWHRKHADALIVADRLTLRDFMDWAQAIPRSGQNPKILGRDDTEVIRYLITIDTPFSGHLLAQKGQDCGFEVSECRMTSIVGDMLVHQPP